MPSIAFAREPLTDALWAEASPLLVAHWQEIAVYSDIPLAPDIRAYEGSEAAGILRCYTVRETVDGDPRYDVYLPPTLVGYALFFVRPAPHYKGSVQAAQDVLFLSKSIRGGTGYKFIAWCDEQLALEGVQVVFHHSKAAHNFGPLLERQGYELMDLIFAKRLDLSKTEREMRRLERDALGAVFV